MTETQPNGNGSGKAPQDSAVKNEFAEQSLVALMLTDAQVAVPAAMKFGVTQTTLATPSLQTLWGGITSLWDTGDFIDPTSVIGRLQKLGVGDIDRHVAHVNTLVERVNTGIADLRSVEYYASQVRDAEITRGVQRLLRAKVADVGSATDIRKFIHDIQYDVLQIAEQNIASDFVGLDEMTEMHMPALEWLHDNPQEVTGLRTPSANLNRLTTGMQPGDLWVPSAEPGVGKTSWMLDTGLLNALKYDKLVFFCSAEMGSFPIWQKLLAAWFKVPMHDLRTGFVTPKDWDRMVAGIRDALPEDKKGRASNFRFLNAIGMTIPEIQGACMSEAARLGRNPDLIEIDYVQAVEPHKGETESQQVSAIATAIKNMTKTLNTAICAASQLNDQGKTFMSKALWFHADVFFRIARDKDPNTGKERHWVHIDKNRMAPPGSLQVRFLGDYGQFADVDDD